MTEKITREIFIPHLNSEFRLERALNAITLELIEVSELRSSRHTGSFSIVFREQADVPIHQAMYRFHHAVLGELDLFITPIGQDHHGLYYQSVFNHLRENEQQ
jgi:hypothetical protein